MLKFLFSTLFLFNLFNSATAADKSTTRQEYIEMWKDEAIYQMVVNKIPASITLAQGILESGDGNSRLAKEGNNHFGIKCHNDWKGKVIIEDDETKAECFRKYDNARESYEDHSTFLKRKRYESLFQLDIGDYKGWARGLKECGYATNPKYPQLLIGIVEEFGLHQFDTEAQSFIKKNQVPDRQSKEEQPVVIASTVDGDKPKKKPRKHSGEERVTINIQDARDIKLSENKVKYIIAKRGDTYESIAGSMDLPPWLLSKYNDTSSGETLKTGAVIYLQPKRNHSKGTHVVKKGDSLWSISQQHAIKLKKLYKFNNLQAGSEPKVGSVLKLQK